MEPPLDPLHSQRMAQRCPLLLLLWILLPLKPLIPPLLLHLLLLLPPLLLLILLRLPLLRLFPCPPLKP